MITDDGIPDPKVPTLAELKARWAANRDWDDACATTELEGIG